MKCDICGKGAAFGHAVSHSKRRTNRPWQPNVQKTTVYVAGQPLQISICTRCLRTSQKAPR